MPMRLNLGCGYRHEAADGWVNVDRELLCAPDMYFDLEGPWPIESNVVDEVRLWHVVEHIGATPEIYFVFIKELYRCCADDAKIDIRVPHYRHDDFFGDLSHTRVVSEQSLWLFSQAANALAVEKGWASTPLGRYLGVDFQVSSVTNMLDPAWTAKGVSPEQLASAANSLNNVIKEVRIELQAIKPAGRTIGVFKPPIHEDQAA
jgi:hypothetical protein